MVVITGASSGIGAATARVLAGRGHRLVLAARRQERLEELATELGRQTEVVPVPTDVTDAEAIGALARRAGETFGGIDVWINNAGVGFRHPWWEQRPEAIDRVLQTNLRAVLLGSRAAIPWMLQGGGGHIINVGSVAGAIGVSSVYSATKFGVRGHTDALRRELRPLGIRVSLVTPGFIRTEMTQKLQIPMPPPERVGEAIARLIRRPRREVVVPGWYRLLIALDRLAPWLTDAVMARRAAGLAGREGR